MLLHCIYDVYKYAHEPPIETYHLQELLDSSGSKVHIVRFADSLELALTQYNWCT